MLKGFWLTVLGLVSVNWLTARAAVVSVPRAEIPIASLVIVTPDRPNPIERWAADDLAEYLGKMSGIRCHTVGEAEGLPANSFPVYLGATAEGRALVGAQPVTLGPDEYCLEGGATAGRLVIAGHDDGRDPPGDGIAAPYLQMNRETVLEGIATRASLGTCRGVWHLLREYGGVRWYLPGELGEVVPSNRVLNLPASLNLRRRPDFAVRSIGAPLWLANRDFARWHFRVGFGAAGDFIFANHSYHKYAAHLKRVGGDAFFGLFDGRRRVRTAYPVDLCHNAPGLPEALADAIYASATNRPLRVPGASYALMPKDGYRAGDLCSCPLCDADRRLALERAAAGGQSFHSENTTSHAVWPLVARVAERLKDRLPGDYITCCSYATYGWPPGQPTCFPVNVGVQLCKERLGYMSPEVREDDRRRIEAWSARLPADNLSIWEYYLYTGWANPIPLHCPRNIAADFAFLKGKVRGERIEIESLFNMALLPTGHIGMQGLNLYVTARCMDDAGTDIDALLDEYYTGFYGPAAPVMRVFFEDLEDKWRTMRPEAGRREDKYSLEFAQLCLDRLAEAQTLVGAGSREMSRIALLRQDFQPWLTLLEQKASPPPVEVPSCDRPPVVDGRLDEAAWQAETPMTFCVTLGYAERGGFPDRLGSVCRLVRHGGDLYLGARIGTEGTPEQKSESLRLMLASPGGERHILEFEAGGRLAALSLAANGNGERALDAAAVAWASTRSDGAWIVEARIPASVLLVDGPGWRVNARIVAPCQVVNPMFAAAPMERHRGRPYVLTMQPEARGDLRHDPKYFRPLCLR